MSNRLPLAGQDNRSIWQNRVVRVHMGGILGGLLDGIHLFFASLLIHGAHHDRLA